MDADLSTEIFKAVSELRQAEVALAKAQLAASAAQRHLDTLKSRTTPGVYEQVDDSRRLLNG